jgi:hypothetical protein
MNTATSVPAAGARRAALMLHAMLPQDRQWLLAALPPPQGRALEEMLAELQALGIPPDRELLQPLADKVESMAAGELACLAPDGQQWLAERLEEEGPEFAARLLAGQACRDAVLARCNQEFRERATALDRAPVPLLQQQLWDTVRRALAQRPPESASRGRFWLLHWRRS